MIVDLSGRVALVGGSTDKIGRATALKLAESGADICVNGRDEEKGRAIVSEIEAMGRRAIFVQANIREYDDCKRMADEVVEKLGRIDILVANGGARKQGGGALFPNYFRDTPIEDFEEMVRSRWLSRAYLMRACLDQMIEQGYGKMISITTDAGRWPTPGEAFNGGAAAGLIMMNRAAGKEFTRWGIRVHTIAISLTGGGREEFEEVLASPVGPTFKKIADRMPFGITPREEVAAAVLYLASPDSDHMSGATLSINGGLIFP